MGTMRKAFFCTGICTAAVLMSGIFAFLWTEKPQCAGALCFDAPAEQKVYRQAQDLRPESSRTGSEKGGDVTQETISPSIPSMPIAAEEEPAAARPTAPASENQSSVLAEAPDEVWPLEDPSDSGLWEGARAKNADRTAAADEAWQALEETALYDPDDARRDKAINHIALHRSDGAVAVLTEVAFFDPSPDNRLNAVQQLWFSAADGLDREGSIESALQSALNDPEDAIREMAERALADLQALAESRRKD